MMPISDRHEAPMASIDTITDPRKQALKLRNRMVWMA
jgi:hypothetical protein